MRARATMPPDRMPSPARIASLAALRLAGEPARTQGRAHQHPATPAALQVLELDSGRRKLVVAISDFRVPAPVLAGLFEALQGHDVVPVARARRRKASRRSASRASQRARKDGRISTRRRPPPS
jgi:hypothetical protein